MKLYLYDFDGTIYDGDSSVDFFKFCYKKGYIKLNLIGKILIKLIQYKIGYITITETKEMIFAFLKSIDHIDALVDEFWIKNKKKLKNFYLDKDHKNDIIISASPVFLLKPICDELKVKDLIASDVNKKTGKFNKPNCRGEEKVKELKKNYPKAKLMEMYSDSYHDVPLLELAEKSYFVKGNKIYDYKTYKPNFIMQFWHWGWSIYHKKEALWNYLIFGGLTTVLSIGLYALFTKCFNINYIVANILSWICAVVFAYFTNRWFVFHSRNHKKLKEAIKFTSMRIITLLLDTLLMILLIELIRMDDLIAKILVQIVVVITNYLISKLLVFKKGN